MSALPEFREVECYRKSCREPAKWMGVWFTDKIGEWGKWDRKPVCYVHAAHDAPGASLRLEELPERATAYRRLERERRQATKDALLSPENRLADWDGF